MPPTSMAAWAGHAGLCSQAVAISINALGYREVLGIAVGDSEAEGCWHQFLGSLKERGLEGTRLVISDAHLGLTAAMRSRAG